MTKNETRSISIANRKNKEVMVISEKIINDIIESKIIDNHNNIGIYYPIGKEIDITKLRVYFPNKKFYLPVTKEEIAFCEYIDPLIKGPFKTMEPKSSIVNRDMIDCFFIPCVGITKDMKRIGYGKGYYDRYLQDYKGLKIGVCYNDSFYEDVLGDSFDIKLDEVFYG